MRLFYANQLGDSCKVYFSLYFAYFLKMIRSLFMQLFLYHFWVKSTFYRFWAKHGQILKIRPGLAKAS